MNFRHLEAFVAVADRGGFTRAAEALLLTQPTVSGQVKELEDELGVVLFDRLPRSVGLTEAGRLFLGEARSILEARERLQERARAYRGILWGRLDVHASTIPGEYLLPSRVAAFRKVHPEVRVSLRVRSSAEVLDRVMSGEAGLGVVGERVEGLGLDYVALWNDRVRLFGAPSLGLGPVLGREALRAVPLVMREEGSGTRKVVARALASAGVGFEELNVLAEFGSTSAVKEALKAGAGAGFLSEVAVASEVESGVLEPLELDFMGPVERRFWAVWDPQRQLSPAARAFRDELLNEFAKPVP